MTWLRDLPIARKFTFAFGIVCCLCLVLAAYTFVTLHGIATKSTDVSTNALPATLALSDARGSANRMRREDLDLLLCLTPACITEHIAKRQKAIEA